MITPYLVVTTMLLLGSSRSTSNNAALRRAKKAQAKGKDAEKEEIARRAIRREKVKAEATFHAKTGTEKVLRGLLGKRIELLTEKEYRAYLDAKDTPAAEIEGFVRQFHRAQQFVTKSREGVGWPDWLTVVLGYAGITLMIGPAVLAVLGVELGVAATAAIAVASASTRVLWLIKAASEGVGSFLLEFASGLVPALHSGSKKAYIEAIVQGVQKMGINYVFEGIKGAVL